MQGRRPLDASFRDVSALSEDSNQSIAFAYVHLEARADMQRAVCSQTADRCVDGPCGLFAEDKCNACVAAESALVLQAASRCVNAASHLQLREGAQTEAPP